jgi:hypothetical protein
LPAPETSAQLPEAQLWQAPQLVAEQQVPSTQPPLRHCAEIPQAVPFASCGTQVLLLLQ